MGIAEKKKDTLISIDGNNASQYEQDVKSLLQGNLPPFWKEVPSSKEAFVAVNTKLNIYYKEFLPRNKFEKIKEQFKGSRCFRARKQSIILENEGLPSPKILCWGKGRENNFLITEGFPGVGFFHFLQTFYTPPLNANKCKEKRELLKETGELIGKMHKMGIVHGDLRPNNLLIQKNGEDFKFCFIDNERNTQKRTISYSDIIKNLIQFSMITRDYLSRTDLLRVYKAYQQHAPSLSEHTESELLNTVFTSSNIRILESQMKFNLKNISRKYSKADFQGVYVVDSLLGRQLEREVDPHQWFDSGGITLKHDKNITVKLIPGPNNNDVIVKRFSAKNIFYHIKVWLKKERVFKLWDMTHSFKLLGVPVADTQGYILEGKGIWRTVSYFYSDNLKNKIDLRILSREIKDFPHWLENKKLVTQFAEILARLHNNGFCHGDTKWANIMVDKETGAFGLIDLDGATSNNSPLGHEVCKDLSRFLVEMVEFPLPEAHFDTFISTYCTIRKMNHENIRTKIAPHIRTIIARHQKKQGIKR